jgi:hypothetical protein
MTHLIYCLEPEQNVEQNIDNYPKGVIKIGIQESENDNRIESYGKNSIVHFRVLCENPREIENVMKSVFLENDIHLTKGKEYFLDDINKIKTLFKETLKEKLLEKDLRLFLFQEQFKDILQEDDRIFYHIKNIINNDNTEFLNEKKKLENLKVKNKIAKKELLKKKIQRDIEKQEKLKEQEREKQEKQEKEIKKKWKDNMDKCVEMIKINNEKNKLKMFIEENYILDLRMKNKDIYNATTLYDDYIYECESRNERSIISKKEFLLIMENFGYDGLRDANIYCGYKLKKILK